MPLFVSDANCVYSTSNYMKNEYTWENAWHVFLGHQMNAQQNIEIVKGQNVVIISITILVHKKYNSKLLLLYSCNK